MTDILIPGKILEESGISLRDFMVDLAVYLYQRELMTMGQARKLAGLDQISFQKALAERGVFMHYGVEDLHEDLRNLKSVGL